MITLSSAEIILFFVLFLSFPLLFSLLVFVIFDRGFSVLCNILILSSLFEAFFLLSIYVFVAHQNQSIRTAEKTNM